MADFLGIIFGILLLLAGIFLIFFFPGTKEHQPGNFTIVGVLMGIIFFIVGVVLIFF